MLVRLNATSFAELEEAWSAQCAGNGEDFTEYASPSIEHARSIAAEKPTDSYGIFCMRDDESREDICLMHGNVARLPKTNGKTLRVAWVLLAQKYDFEDVQPDKFARITANLIMDAITLALQRDSQNVKLHLGNTVDRNFFAAVAATLQRTGAVSDAAIRGNWLHITM